MLLELLQYMPDIGKWNGMDQLSEIYQSFSPYAYVVNNPTMLTDPDGRWIDGNGNMSDRSGQTSFLHGQSYQPLLSMGNNGMMSNPLYQYYSATSSGATFTGANAGSIFNYLRDGGSVSFKNGYMSWWEGIATTTNYRIKVDTEGIELFTDSNPGKLRMTKITQGYYNPNPYRSESSNVFSNIDYDAIKKITDWKNFSTGLQTQFMEYAVRNNYKSANSWLEFNKLRKTQQEWRTINTLGKEGAQLLKVLKVAGNVATIATTGYTAYTTYDYYINNGGNDWRVGAKAGLDLVMTGVGFLGPIGFSISATYFVVDAATGGFGGFGAIPKN